MRKPFLSLALSAALIATAMSIPAMASAEPFTWWTEPSSTSVFKDSTPTSESGKALALDTATNEYESGQIVLRTSAALTVTGVSFDGLERGRHTIASPNLSYNFVTYQQLNANSPIYPPVRQAPAAVPDNLSNDRTIDVPESTIQSIWVTVHVPKGTRAGTYEGTATVHTSQGDQRVPLAVDVRDVAIPDPKDGAFTNAMWNTFNGELSWKPDGDTIEETYGYERFTPQWWELMEDVAAQMKRHRTNDLALPLVGQLLDAGSRMDADGTYHFDWTRFDQVVQFFLDRGVIKRLEGFWVAADTDNYHGPQDGIREVELINRDEAGNPIRDYRDWNSAAANNFIDQFIPALKAHLEAKGWDSMYWMHIGDEPANAVEEEAYRGIAQRVKKHWPTVKIGDAVVHEPSGSNLAQIMDVVIPNLLNYNTNPAPYDELQAQGKELWFYNCNVPLDNYLNRFIDQPQWNQRLTQWYAYSRGASGYLHYSMNGWLVPLDEDPVKGDHYIIWPDPANNRIQSSIRYESLRDGIEDYEVLNLLGKREPGLAKGLATAIVQRADKYSPDTGYQARIRRLMLDAAAGKPLIDSDLARGARVAASSTAPGSAASNVVDGDPSTTWRPATTSAEQWLTVDLGQQAQVDGIRLAWAREHASSHSVQLSYDGSKWTDTSTTTSDGGDDFIGVNGKTRYLRLKLAAGEAYGLRSVEVAGQRLADPNLLGGRSYTVTPAPDSRWPDSGSESTDGVLADAFDDGRTYGFVEGQPHAEVTFDLGRTETVGRARIHAYEEYPGYRPTQVTVLTSTDGEHYEQQGTLAETNDQSRIWYELEFAPTNARYIKVSLDKTYTADDTAMFIDEMEVYPR